MREDARFRCKQVRVARERLSALSSERSRPLDWSWFWCYQKACALSVYPVNDSAGHAAGIDGRRAICLPRHVHAPFRLG